MVSREALLAVTDLLAQLYPTIDDARVVAEDAGLDLPNVAFDLRARFNWLEILREAHGQGKVPDLLRRGLKDYPDKHRLQTAQTWDWGQPTFQTLIDETSRALNFEWNGRLRKVLTIPRADWDRERDPPSALLQAKYAVVPFLYREAELFSLNDWCTQDRKFALRLYWGQGGMGKTRLFLEFCTQLQGWRAGFLDAARAKELLEGGWEVLLMQDRPTLIVVDYAEGRIQELVPLLKEAYARFFKLGHKIRLVLLSRGQGEWWNLLKSKDSDVAALFDGPASQSLELKPVAATLEQTQAVFDAAIVAFTPHFSEPPQGRAQWERELGKDYFERVLLVQMAALLSFGPFDPRFLGSPEQVLEGVLSRDNGYWRKRLLGAGFAESEVGPVAGALEVVQAQITLGHIAQTPEQAYALFCRHPTLANLRGSLPNLLDLLNRSQTDTVHIPPVEPDLLGEYLVYRELNNPQHGQSTLLDTYGDSESAVDAKQSLTVVSRMVAWNRKGAEAIAKRIEEVVGPQRGPLLFESLVAFPTTVLRQLAVKTGKLAVEAATPKEAEEVPLAEYGRFAQILGNYANRLSVAGDRIEALKVAQQTSEAFRALSELYPDDFQGDFAASLSNLGALLGAMGRREAALEAAQQAADIFRRLAEANPDAFQPDLAMSLSNLGNLLGALGRREEALAAAAEAAETYRVLARSSPDAFLPDLAMSLSILGATLRDLGRRDDALEVAQQAADIFRRLASASPDAFLPDLAGSLNNLAVMLGDLGRQEEALAAAKEATEAYRALAEGGPDAFLPDLASSLNNLGRVLGNLGRREESLAAAQEAEETYRRLAETAPDAFLPGLASSLNNLGSVLGDLGRRDEALAAAQEAEETYRRLAETAPDAFLPGLASSLINLGATLGALGRLDKALAAGLKATDTFRRLALSSPDAYLPYLAASLSNLGATLGALGLREEALAAGSEATETYRALAEISPDAFLPDLARSLSNLGAMLSALGRREEALRAGLEATSLYRHLHQASPSTFAHHFSMSLLALSDTLEGLGRIGEACDCVLEGLRVIAPLLAQHPQAFDQLARHMGAKYIERCQKLGREPDQQLLGQIVAALQGQASTVSLEQLAEALPTAHQQYLEAPSQETLEPLIELFNAYLEACQQKRTNPDMQMLEPILKTFQKLGLLPEQG